jgi:GDPmannose 4,6-dehydratase
VNPMVVPAIGVSGQARACLADSLLKNSYLFLSLRRRSSPFNPAGIEPLDQGPHADGWTSRYSDPTGSANLIRSLQPTRPEEIHNLASNGHAKTWPVCSN